MVVRRHAWRPARPRVWATGGRSFARASDSPPTRSTNSCTRASHVQLAGNVRELANTIERAALLTKGEAITAKDLGIDRT